MKPVTWQEKLEKRQRGQAAGAQTRRETPDAEERVLHTEIAVLYAAYGGRRPWKPEEADDA